MNIQIPELTRQPPSPFVKVTVKVIAVNGTGLGQGEGSPSTNVAIVIALLCITAVLAIAVLVTICIIRRIDKERKHDSGRKLEEQNIYHKHQQQLQLAPADKAEDGDMYKQQHHESERMENEIDRLKKKIKVSAVRPLVFPLQKNKKSKSL